VYSFQGTAGHQVVGSASRPYLEVFTGFESGEIIGPDGRALRYGTSVFFGEPVTLPVSGTYKVVATGAGGTPFTFTLWDGKDAPANVTHNSRSSSYSSGIASCTSTSANGASSNVCVNSSASGSTSSSSSATPTPTTSATAP